MRLTVLLAASLPLTLSGPALAQGGPPAPPATMPADAGAPADAGPPPPPPVLADLPPPPPPPPVEVYVLVGQNQRGPLELGELADLVRDGDLRATTYVWMQGMGQWAQAADVPEVAEVLATVEAPPPPLSYYVALRGRTTGPFGGEVLAAQAAAGTLTGDTLVYATGMEAWAPASTRPDLMALISPSSDAAADGPAPGDGGSTPEPDGPAVGDDTPADPAVEDPVVGDDRPAVEDPLPGGEPPAVDDPVVGDDQPAVEEPAAPRGPVAALVGRWQAKRAITLDGVGAVDVDLTITRAADGTAKLEGRGKGTEDPTVTLVLRADALQWSATEPDNGRTSLANTGDIEVMVRRAGQPTERSVVAEDVMTEFDILDAGTIRDTGDGTTWTRR